MDGKGKSSSATDCLNKKKPKRKDDCGGKDTGSAMEEDCELDLNEFCVKRDAARRGQKPKESDHVLLPLPKPDECKDKENPCLTDGKPVQKCAPVVNEYKCGPSEK